MGWQLPSLSALRTFEAAARHLSFTKAAAELNLTQSAVSRQIRIMEEYLGVPLFERVKKTLVLTNSGNTYVTEIRSALEQMQTATVNLLAHRGMGGILTLATPPAFCVKWLIPRLHIFGALHPEILIVLATRTKPFNFEVEKIDAAIHFGNQDWPEVLSDKLVGDDHVIVCSPSYLQSRQKLRNPSDLGAHTLLQQVHRPDWWRDWFKSKNIDNVDVWSGPRFDHFYMIMQAAIAGLGVALLPRLLVSEDVSAGRLVIPFESKYIGSDSYCLVYPAHKKSDSKLELLRDWLISESKNSRPLA